MEQFRNLPLGIQTFERLITEKNIYVDKSRYVYELAKTYSPYFLSRPRRFGKSLFLSTLRAYFEGRKDLFAGLELEELEPKLAKMQNRAPWIQHPILYLDFNTGDYSSLEAFRATIEKKLIEWESLYGLPETNYRFTLADRFADVIKAASEKTGQKTVVLVDEYDKPLLNVVNNMELLDSFRMLLKSFYGVLKGNDRYLRFAFLTGVTRFDKVSIFSDLNNLFDISMSNEFAAICGYTQKELERNFAPEIEALAVAEGITKDECLAKLKEMYDGYVFSSKPQNVYNPFSAMSAFKNCEFGNYWFETGTPTFLVDRLRTISFDVRKFTDGTLYKGVCE